MGQSTVSSAELAENEHARVAPPRWRAAAWARHALRVSRVAYVTRIPGGQEEEAEDEPGTDSGRRGEQR